MGKSFWGVVSAAVEQSRRKANMVAQGDGPLRLTPGSLQTKKKSSQTLYLEGDNPLVFISHLTSEGH